MEELTNKRISIERKINFSSTSNLNHHSSFHYATQFYSKNLLYRRNSNSQIIHIDQFKKDEIFQMVYRFIARTITDSSQLKKIFLQMKFQNSDETISFTKINQQPLHNENQDSSSSFSSVDYLPQSKSLACSSENENENNKIQMSQDECKQEKKRPQKTAKISILLSSFSDFSLGSMEKTSCSSINLSSFHFPPHILTIEIIGRIFEQPESFLINLALCLFLKFLYYSKLVLNFQNSCWILSIATIVAYKIYYDDPVGGLIDSFSGILQIKPKQIKDLQRYFLETISFRAIITNQQYHLVLTKIANSQ